MSEALRPIRRRIRWLHTIRGLCLGALAALGWLVALSAASFFVPMERFAAYAIAGALGCVLCGTLAGALWPVTALDAARQADASGALRERAQTALSLLGEDTPMARLQREDAQKRLKRLDARKALPLRIPRHIGLCAAALCVCFAALQLLPNPQDAVLRQRAQTRADLAAQADALEQAAERMAEQEPLTDKETRELRRITADTARALRQAQDNRDALTALDTQQKEMERLQQQVRERLATDTTRALGSQPSLQRLASAIEAGEQSAVDDAIDEIGEGIGASEQQAKDLAEQLSAAAAQASASDAKQALEGAASASASRQSAQAAAAIAQAAQGAMQAGECTTASNLGALMAMARSGAAASGGTGTGSGSSQRGGTGAGQGSTNRDAGISRSGAGPSRQGSQAPNERLGVYERIYDPTRVGGDSEASFVQGEQGEGESQQIQLGAGTGTLEGSVPYPQVIGEYREAAAQAMQRASLPAAVQSWVNEYFDALID